MRLSLTTRQMAATVVAAGVTLGQGLSTERMSSTLVSKGPHVDAVSPDGRFLVFTNWNTGDLLLYDPITGKDRVAVNAHNKGRVTSYAEGARISRDGKSVAYGWFDGNRGVYELWIAPLTGTSAARRVYGDSRIKWIGPGDWSPDGKSVAAWLRWGDRTIELAVIDTKHGDVKILKSGHVSGASPIFFSPDGKYVAYDLPQEESDARDVWVTAVDGTEDTVAAARRGQDVTMGWSPEGKYLFFTSDRQGSMALWAQRMSEGAPQGPPLFLKPDMGLAESLGVTPSGSLFYGTQRGKRGGAIEIAGFDSFRGTVSAPSDVSANPSENNVNPHWSPHGKYLAYISERGRPGTIPVLVIRDASTNRLLRELEPKLQNGELAGWEPNSHSLLMVGENAQGKRGAFRVNAESGSAQFLFGATPSPTLSMPVWSTDGSSIYYWTRTSGGDEHAFVKHELRSGKEKELTRMPFLGPLNLSPDGQWIATESIDISRNERILLLVPVDGGESGVLMRVPSSVAPEDLRNVINKGARLSPMAWLADAKSLLVRLQQAPEAESELWQVPIDGRSQRKLPSPLEAHVFAFKLSPDGQRVAYRIKNPDPLPDAQVWRLDHFIPVE